MASAKDMSMPTPTILAANTLATTARKRPTRGFTHLFLGDPLAVAPDKTTVEPGGAFSPGLATCGVRCWLAAAGGWISADDQPVETIQFTLIDAPGGAPLAVSRWTCADVQVVQRHGHLGGLGCEGVDAVDVEISRASDIGITVTDRGPAGAKLVAPSWDPALRTLVIPGVGRLVIEDGEVEVAILTADESHDSPVVGLVLRQATSLRLRFHHDRASALLPRQGLHDDLDTAAVFAAVASSWKQSLPARVFAPDPRIALAWERNAYHVLAAAECGCARIGVLNYPQLWMRDAVIVTRAFDLIGRPDLARRSCEEILPQIFAGGFGAEADAPGEGIWILVQHALITGDQAYLARAWPFIAERVRWIETMLSATGTILVPGANRTLGSLGHVDSTLLCLAAQGGLVHGRMDGHFPDFYINAWCLSGLEQAALAAGQLGSTDEAARLHARATTLATALADFLPHYGNERDPAVAPWPTGVVPGGRARLGEHFMTWYRRERLDQTGGRRPEPLWTYFEAAQAHNAFLLGYREEAWSCLSGLLDCPNQVHHEGAPSANETLPFGNGETVRGWLAPDRQVGGNMPHNWTSSEMIAALRDVFVVDDPTGLRLGAGVPSSWLFPGARFGVSDLPTRHGRISYTVTIAADGRPHLDLQSTAPCTLDLPR